MMVPTGRERVATSTSGPAGTAGLAAAVGAPAPLNMFFAVMAVTAATMSAPISSTSFFTSMTPVASSPSNRAYTSDKLVKKPFANQPKTAKCDGDAVRNFGLAGGFRHPVRGQHRNGQDTAGDRHDRKQLHDSGE